MPATDNSSPVSSPILSSLIAHLYLCVHVRSTNLILSNLYGTGRGLWSAYLHQWHCGLVSHMIWVMSTMRGGNCGPTAAADNMTHIPILLLLIWLQEQNNTALLSSNLLLPKCIQVRCHTFLYHVKFIPNTDIIAGLFSVSV